MACRVVETKGSTSDAKRPTTRISVRDIPFERKDVSTCFDEQQILNSFHTQFLRSDAEDVFENSPSSWNWTVSIMSLLAPASESSNALRFLLLLFFGDIIMMDC